MPRRGHDRPRIQKRFTIGRRRTMEESAMKYNEIGIKAMQEGRAEDAIQAFTNAIEEQPEDALGYINFGHVLASMNETERAERFFQKALTLDETSATAYYGLANLYFNAERYEEALKLYEKAVQNGIEGSDAHYM